MSDVSKLYCDCGHDVCVCVCEIAIIQVLEVWGAMVYLKYTECHHFWFTSWGEKIAILGFEGEATTYVVEHIREEEAMKP